MVLAFVAEAAAVPFAVAVAAPLSENFSLPTVEAFSERHLLGVPKCDAL